MIGANRFVIKNRIRLVFFIWLLLITTLFLIPVRSEKLPKNSDKIFHIFASFITASLCHLSLKMEKLSPAFLFTIFYGLAIEILQSVMPYREFSLVDILSNISGGVIFLITFFFLRFSNSLH
ncbi:MAG: VanZ family protein [Candidatus Aminicenantia bacterium]